MHIRTERLFKLVFVTHEQQVNFQELQNFEVCCDSFARAKCCEKKCLALALIFVCLLCACIARFDIEIILVLCPQHN